MLTNIKTIILLSIALLLNSGCDTADINVEPTGPSLSPVAVGIVYDQSGSVNNHPDIDSVALHKLMKAVGNRGGLFSVGSITEFSFTPLLTAQLKLDTVAIVGNLKKRAVVHQNNLAQQKEYDIVQMRFFKEVLAKLRQKRTAKATDIVSSLERYSILFSQPSLKGYDKILILLTDGKHNSGGSYQHIPDAEYYTVGWHRDSAERILGQEVIQFESFTLLSDYLVNTRLLMDSILADAKIVEVIGK